MNCGTAKRYRCPAAMPPAPMRPAARLPGLTVLLVVGMLFVMLPAADAIEAPEPALERLQASDGIWLSYLAFEPDSPRAAVMLFHRGGLHSRSGGYRKLAEKLSGRHQLAVYLADIRGHGASGKEPGSAHSINRVLQDIRELYDHLRERTRVRVYLAGHSSGAGMLVNYAVYPYRREPAGYLLIAPDFGPDAGTQRSEAPALATRRTAVFALASATIGLLGGRRTALDLAEVEDEIRQDPLVHTSLSRNIAVALTPRRPQAQVNRIARPTAFIVGEHDEYLDPGRVLAYRNLLPASVRPFSVAELVPDSDHSSVINYGAEVIAGIIADWEATPTVALGQPAVEALAATDALDPYPYRPYRETTAALFLSSLAEAELSILHERARRLNTAGEPAMSQNYTGIRIAAAAGPTHGELALSGFARPVSALELELGAVAATGWSIDNGDEGLRTAETGEPLRDDPHGALLLRPFAAARTELQTRRLGAGRWFGIVGRLGAELTHTTLFRSDASAYEYRMTGRREPGWTGTLRGVIGYDPPLMLSRVGVEAERTRDGVLEDGRNEPWFTTVRPVLSFTPLDRLELHAFLEFADREIHDDDERERSRRDALAVYRAGLTVSWRF